jgi:hypothetical protein
MARGSGVDGGVAHAAIEYSSLPHSFGRQAPHGDCRVSIAWADDRHASEIFILSALFGLSFE